jgi:Na+/phosphate symporter
MSPTTAALVALCDLVDTARDLAAVALKRRDKHRAARLHQIAQQLDATRTRLVQDGEDYIRTAWAYVDTARRMLAIHKQVLA